MTIVHEVELIEGKDNVVQYLRDRFQDKSRYEALGTAELARMGDQSKARQVFTNLHEGDQCLRFPRGILKPHGAILVLDASGDGKIASISVCVLVHEWAGVVGSGIYPK